MTGLAFEFDFVVVVGLVVRVVCCTCAVLCVPVALRYFSLRFAVIVIPRASLYFSFHIVVVLLLLIIIFSVSNRFISDCFFDSLL